MTERTQQEFNSPTGRAVVAREGQQIVSISIWMEGTLQSYRDKMFSSRNRMASERKIREAAKAWLMQMLALGVHHELRKLQNQCGMDSFCIRMIAEISRKKPIRDFKDMVAGFDHMILDPLVADGILIDDDMQNIGIPEIRQLVIKQGVDTLFLKFERSSEPCRDSITRQILEFGWPDPEFRTRKKSDRRREIRERMANARTR